MPFKCAKCEMTFDTAEQFMEHKRSHKSGTEPEPAREAFVCLKCGAPIRLVQSQSNFRGEMHCPGCGQKLRVRLEDGEVLFASTIG